MRKLFAVILNITVIETLAFPARADSNDAFQFLREEATVVTASRREQSIREAPVAVDVITSEEIKASGVTNIWDLLRYQPGVEVVDGHTPHGNRALVTIRGFVEGFARNVLVLVDGRSVYDVNTGSVYWEQLPVQLQDVDRIEIIRGPNAALYGSGAGLGVINILTKKPTGTTTVTVQGAGGNRSTVLASESIDSSIHGFNYRLSHNFHQEGGFNNVAGGTGNDFLHSHKANFRSHWNPTQGSELELFGGGSWSKIGVPNVATAQDDFNQHFEMLKFNTSTSENFHLELLSSRNDWIANVNPTVVGDTDRNRTYQYNESILHRIDWGDGRLNSTYGFDYQYAHTYSAHEFADNPNIKNQIWRWYLNQTARLNSYATLVGAIAWEATDITKPHPNYQIASLLEPVKNQTFRTSYSVAYTVPTLRLVAVNERQDPTTTRIGNSSIQPEKLTSYETGYRGAWLNRHLETETNLFYTLVENIDDDFDKGTTPVDFIQFVNTNQAIIRGAEMQMKYRFSPRRSMYLNYTYANLTDRSGNIGEITHSTPPHAVNLGGMTDLAGGLSGSFNLGYKDAYIIDNLAAETAPHAYWRLDARLAYQLPWYKKAELFVAGQNLAASNHVEFADALTVPRTYQGGITVKFGGTE